MTNTDPLTALSPLDGRYQQALLPLSKWWSESALIKHRLIVEAKWLIFLAQSQQLPELPPLSAEAQSVLADGLEHFSLEMAKEVKSVEKTTNHDVKAIEYVLKTRCENHPELAKVKEFIHFGCTSEDINNLAYGLMLKGARETVILPQLNTLLDKLVEIAHQTAEMPLLARTHGQPATPTTVGKEMANFAYRLRQGMEDVAKTPIRGKFNGAVGNFNAHYFAYPEVNWQGLNQNFVESLGLVWNPYTTQIEPHDYIATLLHGLMRCNQMLIDLARDMWGYIAFGYFKQKPVEGEVGSSTMPHKVNPIDFENAEGNLGLSNALAHFLSQQLLTSRFQRDLVDSTLMRNIGTALGYASLAYQNLSKGLAKLSVNTAKINADLDAEWAILAEPIQMIMRRYGLPAPYEQLKALTRGQPINQSILHTFIDKSALPEPEKIRLKTLTPASYLGLATCLAKAI